MLVRVVGVDLAAEPVRTAVAVLGWDGGKAVVEDLRIGADDEAVLAALAAADKAGIDAPFGWPDPFVAFLAVHQAGNVPVPGAAAPWLELGSHDLLCRTSHDALDAVIAALTARAAVLGLTLRPDPELQPQASREGWIALPTAPLAKLT